jgi:DNA polymerase-3 subunit alpha
MLSNGTTNIDSITNFRDYIARAKDLSMSAICFTEHGNLFEWIHKKEAVEKAGMKYIHGIEAYITESLEEKVRDNYHCVLIAKNYDGVLELNQLVSESYNRNDGHFYYMPRILYDDLEKTSDNIIISTACLGGILHKGNENIRNRFICFLQRNKHRCFLEIQHHIDNGQKEYNKYLHMLSKEIGVPLITGTDTHALNEEHLEGRSILQKSKNVFFADEESWDLTFKSYDELISAYEKQNSLPMDVVKEAINNTNVLADMVEEFDIDRTYKYPHLWENPMKTFQDKIMEGIKKRGVDKYPNYQEYIDRIKHELKAYEHNGAIDFMLLMDDIISWCIEKDIRVGYGRGSVNGSVIAWLLGITEMDSIKHNLNFERFMNTERVSLSDIDTDFPPSRIEEVKQYIFSKTGLYCCDIVTFNTVADKGAIRDVGRALNIPLTEVAAICDSVDNEELYEKSREKYKELFKYVDLIKGTIVSVGSHPCGCVVAPFTITDRFGTFTTSTSNYPVSQINMKEIDSLNYVKLDLLRLDTIELINDTCKLAGIERLTPDNVDITDVTVWDSIRDDTTQIFQWEGNTGDNYIKKLLSDENIKRFQEVNENVDRMTLLSIGNSAIRPAGASYREDLASGVVRKTGSKPIDDFLSNTFGYLVFQEQIISFLHQYCGFTMGEADIVRRGFAKKTGTDKYIPIIKNGGYLTDKSDHYIKGYITTMKELYGIDEAKSEEDIVAFIQVIEDASSYLFSLNHSQPYSYEGYVSGYLRTHYPLEFLTTALNINKDKEEKTKALTAYAKKCNIIFQSPKFRYSRAGYFCNKETNTIYKGIGSIKFMNETVANELYEMSNMKFDDFVDVLYYLKEKTTLNSRQLDILIKIDFFEEFGDINTLLSIAEKFDLLYGKQQVRKDEQLQKLNVEESIIRMFAEKETLTSIEEIDCIEFVKSLGCDEEQAKEKLSDCIKYKKNEDGEKVFNGYSSKKVFKQFEVTDEQKEKFATKTVVGRFSNINIEGLLKYILSNVEVDKCNLSQRMKYQIEHLGYVEYVNSKLDVRYIVILDIDTTYSPKFKAYCLKTGQICDMKIHSRLIKKDKRIKVSYAEVPLENGDVIYMSRCDKEPKKRKVDDEWQVVPNEFVWWINDYRKVVNDSEVILHN